MQKTRKDTEIFSVDLERYGPITYVWLHRNIEFVEDEEGSYWEADEAHGRIDGNVTVAYVTANFDMLWDQFEQDAMTDRQLIEQVQAQALFTAIMTDTMIGE